MTLRNHHTFDGYLGRQRGTRDTATSTTSPTTAQHSTSTDLTLLCMRNRLLCMRNRLSANHTSGDSVTDVFTF